MGMTYAAPRMAKATSNCQMAVKVEPRMNTPPDSTMQMLMIMRESIFFSRAPANSIVIAAVICSMDKGRATWERPTPNSSESAVKYRPWVLTISPNPMNDRTQQPANTSHGLQVLICGVVDM